MADLAGKKVAYLGFSGPIDDEGTRKLCSALNAAVNNQYDEVYLTFNTVGGYVAHGFYIYNHIRSLPISITIHNTGTVASVGATLFVAAHRRLCAPTGVFMMHPVALGSNGQLMAESLQATLQALLRDEERTELVLKERTSLSDDLLYKRRFTEVYLSAQEALNFGLVEEVCAFALPAGNEVIHL